MNNYLNQYLSTLPQTQRQKLMEILEMRQREGYIKSETEFQAELDRLLKDLDKYQGIPTFKPRKQEGQTDSASYNANMEEIAFDLSTLFSASNRVESLLSENSRLSRSILSGIRKKVYALDAEIERQKLLMNNSDGFVEGVHEQFRSPQYTETSPDKLAVLRKERYGQFLGEKYAAEMISDGLQLSSFETIDQLKNPYGRKLATIKILNRTGSVATNNNNPIDAAIDGSQDTFWAEVILADDVITHDISDIWTHDYEEYPQDGAMCEIEISLNGITTVSEITFDPYCSYPMEIVAVHGYESTDYTGKSYALITPNHENAYQRSRKSVGQISFQFPSVDISVLRVLIRQENYVKENYIVSKDEQNNMELWDKMAGSSELLSLGQESIADKREPGETIAEFDKKNEMTGWNRYLSALKEWAEKQGDKGKNVLNSAKSAMELIRTGSYQNPMSLALRSISSGFNDPVVEEGELAKQFTAASKHSYLYGLYNVSVTGRKYLQRSIYVSQGLPLSGNTKALSLSTEEKHHDINLDNGDKQRITDIEYYVCYKSNPDVSSWMPILPIEKNMVIGEILLGSSAGEEYIELTNTVHFSFRFPIISKSTVVVRRDGRPIGEEQYVISDDGKKIGIRTAYYSASSIYTVDYKPADEAYIVGIDPEKIKPVQYISPQGETGEYFKEAKPNRTVAIQHSPYIYRKEIFAYDSQNERYDQKDDQLSASELYYPVIVRVGGVELKNITDYASASYDRDRLQTENGGKAFAQIGKEIFFPDSLELKDITVDYYYMTTDIRLKAILRRNTASHESVTPTLYSYALRAQNSDQEVRV